MIELKSGNSLPAFVREQADEVWVLFSGEAEFHWQDLRENSPTFNAVHKVRTDAPMRVLVPFGVRFNLSVLNDSALLRISTHPIKLNELSSHKEVEARDE
jgi:dTDP-4-dehydrorhamnose 3,5-epimerase-like enzyme